MPQTVSIGNVNTTPGSSTPKLPSVKKPSLSNPVKTPKISENSSLVKDTTTEPKTIYDLFPNLKRDPSVTPGAQTNDIPSSADSGNFATKLSNGTTVASGDYILKDPVKSYSDAVKLPNGTTVAAGTVYDPSSRTATTYGHPDTVRSKVSNSSAALDSILSSAEKNKAIRDKYASSGGVVDAAQYMSESGIPGGIRYDTESNTVNVGAIPVTPEYVSDGKAYITRTAADNAIKEYKDQSGLTGNKEVVDRYNDLYDDRVQDRLDRVVNYNDFEYNPDTDPAYQAYRNQYIREANDAFERAMESSRRSAYGSSGATLAQMLADRDNYLDKVTDAIPQFVDSAYDRYTGGYNMAANKLDSTRSVANDAYNKLYQSNRDTWSDTMENNTFNLNRPLIEAQTESQAIDNDYGRRQIAQLNQSMDQAAVTGALARGYYTSNDIQYSPWLQSMIDGGIYALDAGGRVVDSLGNLVDVYNPVQRYAASESIGQNVGPYWYDQITANTPTANPSDSILAALGSTTKDSGTAVPDYNYWLGLSSLPAIPEPEPEPESSDELVDGVSDVNVLSPAINADAYKKIIEAYKAGQQQSASLMPLSVNAAAYNSLFGG